MEVERAAEYFDYLAGLSKYASASRFLVIEIRFGTNQTPGKNPRRGLQPPSWSFYRGLQRGRIETPPLPFSFYRQRLFLCRAKKKGLNRLLAPSGRENAPAPSARHCVLRAQKKCHPLRGGRAPRPSGAVSPRRGAVFFCPLGGIFHIFAFSCGNQAGFVVKSKRPHRRCLHRMMQEVRRWYLKF